MISVFKQKFLHYCRFVIYQKMSLISDSDFTLFFSYLCDVTESNCHIEVDFILSKYSIVLNDLSRKF